jgi:hypothetical protein
MCFIDNINLDTLDYITCDTSMVTDSYPEQHVVNLYYKDGSTSVEYILTDEYYKISKFCKKPFIIKFRNNPLGIDFDKVDYITCDTSVMLASDPPMYHVNLYYKDGSKSVEYIFTDEYHKISKFCKKSPSITCNIVNFSENYDVIDLDKVDHIVCNTHVSRLPSSHPYPATIYYKNGSFSAKYVSKDDIAQLKAKCAKHQLMFENPV